jgi:hypothetical protein
MTTTGDVNKGGCIIRLGPYGTQEEAKAEREKAEGRYEKQNEK